MGATRLLANGERDAETDRRCQQAAGQAPAPVAQREIEGHQGETGRGMGARKAMALRHAFRTVGEERGVDPVAAVAREVARAVHARHLLEPADDGRGQNHGEHHVTRAQSKATQPCGQETCGPEGECGEPHEPHEHGAARVDQVNGPPGVRADPGAVGPVEEERIREAPVQVEGGDRREGRQEQGGGQPGMQQPET